MASASALSIAMMRAAGCGHVTTATWRVPARATSAAKRPLATAARQRPRQGDIGREAALADDEAPVLAHAAVGRYEPERRRAHGVPAGRFRLRMRSTATAISSTICA